MVNIKHQIQRILTNIFIVVSKMEILNIDSHH